MFENKVSDFFNSYASDFNDIYGNKNTFLNKFINKYFRKSMKLRYIKTIEGCYPTEGKSIIDVGCGPGHFGIALAKNGARVVWGIDFAKAMIDLAIKNALSAGVKDKCNFICGDFMTYPVLEKFDYSIVMGFMDYIKEPTKVVEKVVSITKTKAFFSFPEDGGLLAWQRKLRYKKKCDLFMYKKEQLQKLFANLKYNNIEMQELSRDLFVVIYME